MSGQRVEIPGSSPQPGITPRWHSALSPDSSVSAVLTLRRRAGSSPSEADLLSGYFKPIAREDAAQRIGADPADLAAVQTFASEYGLTIVKENPAARTVEVTASASQIGDAFGARLARFQAPDGQEYISYEGPLSIPVELSDIITAVLGLDQRPVAKHHSRSSE